MSSCSSLFYSNRKENNTFSIYSNVKNFEVKFPNSRNESYNSNNGNFTHTLPKLNRNYTTIDIVSKDYVTQRISINKSIRIGPLLLDLLSFPLTLGIPVLVDVFKSDFYKISNDSKTNSITLVNTQSFMTSQFYKIKGSKSPEIYDRFIKEYPYFEKKELAVNMRDSLEFRYATDSYNEQNITKFIQNRPNSIFIPRATKIESDFIKSRSEFSNVKNKNTVEAFENFIKDYPDAIQIGEAHKLLVESAEKEALASSMISKKIIFLNNYLIPNRKFLSTTDYLNKKSITISKIVSSIELEMGKNDYTSFKIFYSMFNSLDQKNIESNDLKTIFEVIQKQISEILLVDLSKIKTEQDQISFENKIQSDFPNLYYNTNIILNILEKSLNKNGLYIVYKADFLSNEITGKLSFNKYKNKPTIVFEYKTKEINVKDYPIKQVLNFKQNLLEGVQENYFRNEYYSKITVKNLKVNREEYYSLNKLIGINYFDTSGNFSYKYEFENGVNITLKKFDENILQYDLLIARKNLDEALEGYQNLQRNHYPKDLKQNELLIKKIANCQILIDKRDLALEKVRIAEEKRQEIIRIAEEKKQEKLRVAEEKRQAKLQQVAPTRQYNNYNSNSYQNTESYTSHICNYCHRQFTGKGYYQSYSRDGLQINRSDNESNELCCSSTCAIRIMNQ